MKQTEYIGYSDTSSTLIHEMLGACILTIFNLETEQKCYAFN